MERAERNSRARRVMVTNRREERRNTYHLGISNQSALDDKRRLRSEPSLVPYHQVGQLPDLHTSDEVAETLRERRVHGVLAHVPLDPPVVRAGPVVLGQGPPLLLVLVRGVPGPEDDFAAAAHGLRVGGHHGDGAEVVEDVLGGDGLGADARLGEGDVLGDVLAEVVADHEHVQVLVEGVARVGPRGVGRAGQDVGLLHDADDVGGVAATGTFSVISVDRSVLEGGDGGLDEPGFVERVRVNETLDVELIAYGQTRVDGGGCRPPILVKLETTGTGVDLLAQGERG